MIPVGQPLRLDHPALPSAGCLWGAGRPGYPDEPPSGDTVLAGAGAWRAAGVDRVLSLIEDWEVPRRAPGLFEALAGHGIALHRFPVRDFGVPEDGAAFLRLLAQLRARLAAGEGVLVHCNAGLGRTAVALGTLLVTSGFAGDPVAELRRIYRPGAMQEPAQEAFVRGLAPLPGAAGPTR